MQEPDESYNVEGAKYPFVVIEVRDGQQAKKVSPEQDLLLGLLRRSANQGYLLL